MTDREPEYEYTIAMNDHVFEDFIFTGDTWTDDLWYFYNVNTDQRLTVATKLVQYIWITPMPSESTAVNPDQPGAGL